MHEARDRLVPSLSVLMARSFLIINALTGEVLLELGSFPSFSAARKEAGHQIGAFPFPLAVAKASTLAAAPFA